MYVNLDTEVFPHPLVASDGGQSTSNAVEEDQPYCCVARRDSGFSDIMFQRIGEVKWKN